MFKIGQKVIAIKDAFELNDADVKTEEIGVIVEAPVQWLPKCDFARFDNGVWAFNPKHGILEAIDEEE